MESSNIIFEGFNLIKDKGRLSATKIEMINNESRWSTRVISNQDWNDWQWWSMLIKNIWEQD